LEHSGAPARAEHERHIGTVDVGVDDAHRPARPGERHGEVDGDGGLPDAALAGGDRDRMAHLRDQIGAARGPLTVTVRWRGCGGLGARPLRTPYVKDYNMGPNSCLSMREILHFGLRPATQGW